MSTIDLLDWRQKVDDLGEWARVDAVICEDDQKLFRDHLIAELARGERAAIDTIESVLRRLKIKPLPGAVMLVQIDALANAANYPDRKPTADPCGQISSAISTVLSTFSASLAGAVAEDRVAVLVGSGPDSNLSTDMLRRVAECLCQTARLSHQGTLTVGIGSICRRAQDLNRSYHEAKEALAWQVFLGSDRVIDWNQGPALAEASSTPAKRCPYVVDGGRQVRERVFTGDRKGALQALDILLDELRGQPGLTPTAFKSQILQLVVVLCRSTLRIGADVGALMAANMQHAQTIRETDSFLALRAFLRALIDELVDAMLGRGRTPRSEAVILAKRYIAENCYRSPSLREVAGFVHVSPYYFSRLFAKENDCGFRDYVNRVKIEAAKDMLRNSTVNAKQAAIGVGFKDVGHFIRLFRQVEGTTPATFARCVRIAY